MSVVVMLRAVGLSLLAGCGGGAPNTPQLGRTLPESAATEMTSVGGEQDVERLEAAALTGLDPAVRYQAVDALGELGEQAVVPLQRALTDPDEDVRKAAIDALGYIGGDEAASALAVALNDGDPLLREDAVAALGHIGGPAAIALVQYALNDDADAVRNRARDVLADLSNGPAP